MESEEGKGTVFHVFFPVADGPQPTEQQADKQVAKGTERILFIDDEESIVETNRIILEKLGYKVHTAFTPIEALNIFKSSPETFDLVITDMTMPGMTGDRLAREMMTIRPDIPVILCTGYSEHITEDKARQMGIKAFVMKPVIKQRMAEIIRSVLDHAEAQSRKE